MPYITLTHAIQLQGKVLNIKVKVSRRVSLFYCIICVKFSEIQQILFSVALD